MPDIGMGELTNSTTLATLNSTHCQSICNATDSTINYCNSIWRYIGNNETNWSHSDMPFSVPQTHGTISILLIVLFILSVCEGLVEMYVPYSPYVLLYEQTVHYRNGDEVFTNHRKTHGLKGYWEFGITDDHK